MNGGTANSVWFLQLSDETACGGGGSWRKKALLRYCTQSHCTSKQASKARDGWNSNQRRRTGNKRKSHLECIYTQAAVVVVNLCFAFAGAIEGGVRDWSAENGVVSGL